MAKQNKKTSDAPVDKQVNDVVATDEKKAEQKQVESVQTATEADEINNDNDQQGAMAESLGTETKGEATETSGGELDNQIVGRFVNVEGVIFFEVPMDMLRRDALEQLIADCELDINPDGLNDDELREAINELIQNEKAEYETSQAEYRARLTESDKNKIDEVARKLFAKRNFKELYFTADCTPFTAENDAKQHAIKLENKAVIKRTKSDL